MSARPRVARAPPAPHLREGFARILADGRLVWLPACLVSVARLASVPDSFPRPGAGADM
jgi:hypothetical protein